MTSGTTCVPILSRRVHGCCSQRARGALSRRGTRSRAVQFATAVTRPVLPLQGRVAKTHRADRVTRRVVNPAKRYGSMMITGSESPDALLPSTLTSYSTAMSAFLGVFWLDLDFGETFSLFIGLPGMDPWERSRKRRGRRPC